MKTIDLIKYLTHPEQLNELYEKMGINKESEVLLIYMKEGISLDSDIVIFSIEETQDDTVFEKDDILYYQLFPVDYAVELIESDLNLKDKGYADLYIANRLLEYRIKDA